MKVKELDKIVNLAWSPTTHVPVMLAAGSAAQQCDASFNTTSSLDIYDLNLNEPGLDMELKTSIQSPNRFHKLVWSSNANGIIVGGCDSGRLQMYNVSKVLQGEDGLMSTPDRHTGPVKALDFNPFQANLLSSGASESEIFIWDLNNVKTPMTPGAKSQPPEEVLWLAWNKQVQHILASVFPTRCVVWDLRKNEPIIKLSDSNSRVRWKEVAWHPDVATQLCLASEEDSNPVIQLWDLRFATTPIKTLEGHQKGVLSIAWCDQDPELLVSSSKDGRILCWNPTATNQSEEIVCDIMTSNQWNFDVSWCPRNPSLIATSSFDGHASVYSLVGGQQQMQTSNKIADSFPGMEQYAEAPVVQPPHQAQVTVDLRKAPKWLKRPAGATFGFGGKLVSFGGDSREVYLSQVVTEPSLVEQSQRLQQLLAANQYQQICHNKVDPVWTFVAASLEPDSRTAMRTLLGFTQEQLELNKYIGQPEINKLNDVDGLADEFAFLSQDGPEDDGKLMVGSSPGPKPSDAGNFQSEIGRGGFESNENNKLPFKINIGEDKEGVICRALLAGNVALAVDLCVREGRMTDAIILAASAGPDLLAATQYKYFQQSQSYLSHLLSAVVTQDWSHIVSYCDLSSWAEALAAVLTYATVDQLPILCERLGDRLEREGGTDSRRHSEICFVAAGQLGHLIENRIASDISTEALQELVELVLVVKRGDIHGAGISHLLDRYAQMLAAQGDLNTALMYLSTSPEETIEELRERLYIASGQKPYPTAHRTPQNPYFQTSNQNSYGLNYAKQTIKQQPSYTPSVCNAFPPPTSQNFPPPGNMASRKTSFSNPQMSSLPGQSNISPFNPQSSSLPSATPSVPPFTFPQQTPLPPQPQSNFSSGPDSNLFPKVTSGFTRPLPSQTPDSLGQPSLTPRSSVQYNTEQMVPPPPSNITQPPTYSHRSSPIPSVGGSSRKYIVDPSVTGGMPPLRSSSTTQFNSPSMPGLYNSMTPTPYGQQSSSPYPNNLSAQSYNSSQSFNTMPGQSYNSIPAQPFNSTPAQPFNNTPAQPFNSTPAQPFNSIPAPAFNSTPDQPFNSTPAQAQPFNSTPAQAQPFNSTSAPPFNSTPAQPFNRTPGQPLHSTPAQPFNNTPAQPFNNTPAQTFNSTPAQPFNSTPAQPFTSSPAQPFNSTPAQPYNNVLAPPFSSTTASPFSTTPAQSFSNMPGQLYNSMTSQQQNLSSAQSQYPPLNNRIETPTYTPQTTAASGWNDPPPLASVKRAQPKDVQQPTPITHPLLAASQQEFPGQIVPGGAESQQSFNYGRGPQGISGPPPSFQAGPQPAHMPPIAKAEEVMPKPPLAEEHIYLQVVFEELKKQCMAKANNPQLRRKLEEVSRKLEVLYDCLRENKMAEATLTVLNQMVQLVQLGEYTNALTLHTHLVSGPDFSQISGFMPGLKVLIQSALQLHVFLQ